MLRICRISPKLIPILVIDCRLPDTVIARESLLRQYAGTASGNPAPLSQYYVQLFRQFLTVIGIIGVSGMIAKFVS